MANAPTSFNFLSENDFQGFSHTSVTRVTDKAARVCSLRRIIPPPPKKKETTPDKPNNLAARLLQQEYQKADRPFAGYRGLVKVECKHKKSLRKEEVPRESSSWRLGPIVCIPTLK